MSDDLERAHGYDRERAHQDRAHRARDSLATWLVVGNAAALGLLYSAVLSDQLVWSPDIQRLAMMFSAGTACAFVGRYIMGLVGLRKGYVLYPLIRIMFLLSALCLFVGITGPLWNASLADTAV